MLEQIFFLLVYVFGAVIAYIYFSENYELKQNASISLLIAISLYSIGFFINLIFNTNIIINNVLFLIINILYCKLSFKISFKSGIFHSSILLAVMFSTEIIVESSASFFLHIPIDFYKRSITALVILGTICKILYFIVCKIISSLFSYKKNNAENDMKKNFVLFIYPIITTLMLTVFLYTSSIYSFSSKINFIFSILSICSLMFCCVIFVVNENFQKQESEMIRLQSEHQRKEMNKTFYSMLDKKNEEQQILVHDIKHHLAIINSMDNVMDIKKYVSKVQPEIEKHKFIGRTKNKMFDLVLDRYFSICCEKSIGFSVDIRESNLGFIEDNDLVSILSNILDNAVEATDGISNSKISLYTKKDQNMVLLKVVNSCKERPKSKGNRLMTSKLNSAYHGYGIKSIEKTISKYKGISIWDFDETNKEFTFEVIFNN